MWKASLVASGMTVLFVLVLWTREKEAKSIPAQITGIKYPQTPASMPAAPRPSPLRSTKERREFNSCRLNLAMLGGRFREWAVLEGHGQFPFNVSTNQGGTLELCQAGSDGYDRNAAFHFQVLSNGLTPRQLVCPADSNAQPALVFSMLQAANMSYRLRTGKNISPLNPQQVLAICPIHGYLLLCDGSVRAKEEGRSGDNGEVVQRYRKAADQGNAPAQYHLGTLYAYGTGARMDYGEAAKWYRKAADQGYTEAQYQLGALYARGLGVTRDYTEAARWYRLAADKGYAPAQHFLGHLYANGQGLETEYLEDPDPPPKGLEKGIPDQQGLRSDYAEAAKWWRKAADQGDVRAQSDMGWLYAHGRGVATNYAEAATWYRKSAARGNSVAQFSLGWMSANGLGVEKDYAAAGTWYRKSAERGNPYAQANLGRLYATGRGVERDYAAAAKWYYKSADQGNLYAQWSLGGLFASGLGVAKDCAEALKWYRKAADAGFPPAQNSLAWMLSTSTNASVRNGPLAVGFAEKAVTVTRRANATFLDTLAAAHAEAGDFAKAVAIQNEAMGLLKDANSTREDYTSRLKLYESKAPYREEAKR